MRTRRIFRHFCAILSVVQLCSTTVILSSSPLQQFKSDDADNPHQIANKGRIDVVGPLSADFQQWLDRHGYAKWDFAGINAYSATAGKANDLANNSHRILAASFGGRDFADQRLIHRPVVFIHGNSDGALADGNHEEEWSQGWSASIEYFMRHGNYSRAELYAITYGDRNLSNALQRQLDCPTAKRLRRFVEAVLEYTGAEQVDIIAHSMGVSLARLLINGQISVLKEKNDSTTICQLGDPINNRIHTLIGIAGANYGLCICADNELSKAPACDHTIGFWPGAASKVSSNCISNATNICSSKIFTKETIKNNYYGKLLQQLNRRRSKRSKYLRDAENVVSLWSNADQVLGPSNLAYGHLTSLIPGSNYGHIYHGINHFALKWATVTDQLTILRGEQQFENM